jgi:hypothetical protein
MNIAPTILRKTFEDLRQLTQRRAACRESPCGGGRLQAADEVRCALRVAGRGEDRAVVCLEHVQPVGDVGGVVLTRLKRQIKIGTEERGAKFAHEFFDRVAFGPETPGAEVARQARFVCGPMRLMPKSALDAECRLSNCAEQVVGFRK